ncbi:MAG: ester cyclase [Allosphingosinicella sp.]|uniref:ester cyclase n=1 Tax=Allosphingosinicella sp. TaxID=2823234 RepID=UPI003926686C
MSEQVEAHKAVALKFLTQAHKGEVALEDLYTPGYVHHNEAFYPGLEPGFDNFKRALASGAGGISDLQVRVDHLIGEGDKVVARFTLTGRHSGTFQGIPATGRVVTFSATDIYRFENGRIAEGWAMMDFLAFLRQVSDREGGQ